MIAPVRLRLSRAKGFRLPDDAISVARPGPFGNPFVIGKDGDRAYCVELYRRLLSGFVCLSCEATPEDQELARKNVLDSLPTLRGLSLACWCSLPVPGQPDVCHAAVLLSIANASPVQP